MPPRLQLSTAVLLATAALLYCVRLGTIDLWAPDEPRYAQVAEEMRGMEHGARGLFLLHLNGEAYTQKPPLYYWLAAAGGWLSNSRVTETLGRLPSALAGLAVVLLCLRFGPLLFATRSTGRWAGALLLSTYYFSYLTRRIQLDVLLTLFETAALYFFFRIERAGAPPKALTVALLHAAMGLAALTKGPVGWIPLAIIAAYLIWERRFRDLRAVCPPWALLLSVGPILAWLAAATWLAPEGYFQAAVIDNVLLRFYSARSHARPFYYFLVQLPLAFLPWTLLAPLVIAEGRRAFAAGGERRAAWRLLVVWVAVPLFIFSLASGKRGLYMLPSFPALALLCGASLDAWLERNDRLPRWTVALLLASCLSIGIAAWALGTLGSALARPLADSLPPGFADAAVVALPFAGATAAGLLLAAFSARWGRSPRTGLLILIGTTILMEFALFTAVFPRFNASKSPRPIAREAMRLTSPDEPIGIFDDEPLAGGILYYSDRRVVPLPVPRKLSWFLANGGRVFVLERWKLPWLTGAGTFEVLASVREGRRELAVVHRIARPPPVNEP